MNRQGRLSLVLLWLLALTQLWLIYRLEFSDSKHTDALATVDAVTAAYQPNRTHFDQAQILDLLRHIEQRLASQHAVASDTSKEPSALANTPINSEPAASLTARYDQASIAKADQRLTTMLPYGRISQQRLMDFHAELHNLPAAQRVELATALSRAINEGRIEPVPGMP